MCLITCGVRIMKRLRLAKKCVCGGFAEEAKYHGIDGDGYVCSVCGAFFNDYDFPIFTEELPEVLLP